MTGPVEIRGLATLRKRLQAASLPKRLKQTLRDQAEALAGEASANAPGRLGASVEVSDESQGSKIAYAIGTADKAARFVEFGTTRRLPSPWLLPVLHARLPGIKHNIRKLLAVALKLPPSAV